MQLMPKGGLQVMQTKIEASVKERVFTMESLSMSIMKILQFPLKARLTVKFNVIEFCFFES